MPSHKNNADISAWKKILVEHNTKSNAAQKLYEMSMREIEQITSEMDDDRLAHNYDEFVAQGGKAGFLNPIKIKRIRKALTDEMERRGLRDDEDMWESEHLDELSPETLGSYTDKASDARGHRDLPTHKVDNRYAGVARASNKIERKNRDLAKGDFAMYQGKTYRIFGFNGPVANVGEYYGPDSYGGTNSIHITKLQKVDSPEELDEGYKILPNIDMSRYPEINGLEGPFRTLSGHVIYYDPKEGKYYDKDRDMYISYDEFQQMDNDYSDTKDEKDLI